MTQSVFQVKDVFLDVVTAKIKMNISIGNMTQKIWNSASVRELTSINHNIWYFEQTQVQNNQPINYTEL